MQRQGAEIWWQEKGGLRTKQLSSFVHLLLSVEDPPDIMVIHCGGNDIGSTPALKLRADILRELDEVRSLVPGVLIVWSQILPRFEWRGEKSHSALNNVRERVNNKVATEVIDEGGRYIKYPEIREEDHFLLIRCIYQIWAILYFYIGFKKNCKAFLHRIMWHFLLDDLV